MKHATPLDSVLMRVLLRPLVAALQLFAVYVYLHGHYSPGGGFQAGVLLACAVILPLLVHGGAAVQLYTILPERGAAAMASAGVLVFAIVGMIPMLTGHTLMDYAALPLGMSVAKTRSMGILLVELGVTLTVMGVIVSIYYSLFGTEIPADAGAALRPAASREAKSP